ncbi:MAG: AAA family ATPase [Betaproteobacteria bacterium]|jgi:type II secretory pathway predicted ATPase ExeA|nr:AAA family ATPase [Betaproteobacteria bacterium]HNM81121.1 AAA family ATPase [Rhodocyclaceae bacterium]HNP04080.1 AAA family ATPase [Rhodocyclaceae bacterium]
MSLYLGHFGLTEPPFRITPHTDFFFSGANRGPTLDALIYAITQDEGIVKVTGEVGSGKTMLCRMLLEKLPPQVETIYLANPSLSRQEIVGAIADELGIPADGRSTHSLTRALQDALVERYALGKRVVILIDEAHAMPAESLEEVRLLSNLESKSSKLLQIALFAQPELDTRLAASDMRQLRERITQHFGLAPLKPTEVAAYLEFRLRTAGYRGPTPFTERAVAAIAGASEGLSRRINILADKALLAAYSTGSHRVDRNEVGVAIRDSRFTTLAPRRSVGWLALTAVAAVGALGSALYVMHASWSPEAAPAQATASQPEAAQAPAVAAPAPPAVDTPTEPVAPSLGSPALGPLTRQGLDRFSQWLASANSRHYFIQLYGAEIANAAEIEAFLRRSGNAVEGGQLRIYRSDLSGQDRLGVIFGEFATRDAALSAIAELPESLRRLGPYPRQVSRLQ